MQEKILKVYRVDTFSLPKVTKTFEGYLEGEVVASRTGVFTYYNTDGTTRKELRHPDHVLNKDSLKTLSMIPITDDHPAEFVNASNAALLQKGFTGESYRTDENGNIIVKLKVTDSSLINKITSGKKPELSLGYSVELKKSAGEYNGERYDYIQTGIVYNHLAVVEYGRAGRNARFRFDSDKDCNLAECRYDINNIDNSEEKNMSDTTEKKQDHDAEMLKVRFDAVTSERDLLKHRVDTFEAKNKALEATLAQITQERDQLKSLNQDSIIDQRVDEKTDVSLRAATILGDKFNAYCRHSTREIMEATMQHIDKENGISIDYTKSSTDYIKGIFDRATSSAFSSREDALQVYKALANARSLTNGLPKDNRAEFIAKLNSKVVGGVNAN